MAGDFDGGFCVIWAHELCDDVVVGPVVGGGGCLCNSGLCNWTRQWDNWEEQEE